MVDRASVDCSLYNTDTEIAHNIESDLIKSLEENSKGHSSINNSPVIVTERKFQFKAREELGCFPILLDGKWQSLHISLPECDKLGLQFLTGREYVSVFLSYDVTV